MNGASNLIAIGYEALKDVTNQSNNVAVKWVSQNIENDNNCRWVLCRIVFRRRRQTLPSDINHYDQIQAVEMATVMSR